MEEKVLILIHEQKHDSEYYIADSLSAAHAILFRCAERRFPALSSDDREAERMAKAIADRDAQHILFRWSAFSGATETFTLIKRRIIKE